MKAVAVLVAVAFASVVASADGPIFQSVTANNAYSEWEEETTKALKRSNEECSRAKEKLVRRLKFSLAGETRAGNLDEANKIQSAIVLIEAALPARKDAGQPKFSMTEALAGEWTVQYVGGSKQEFSFSGNAVQVKANGKIYNGNLAERNGDWWADMGDNDANRVSLAVGGRIFIEHWRGGANGPPHAVAVGVPR
ncbi:MAG: hypothetical protein WD069_08985 [Planctomycetales bacterium]